MSYSKSPKVIDDLNDVDTTTTVPTNGTILSFDGTNWVPRKNLPVAQIVQTSKISNQLAFTASSSSAILNGDTLAYAWTISPSAGVTIATPAAVSTTISVPSAPAQYTLTLTVTSTLTGLTATDTKVFKTDRILEVNGINAEGTDAFTTLQAAINWITANDNANVTSYVIYVNDLTLDAARIVPNTAKVIFKEAGRITQGVDFGAGAYQWGGVSKNQSLVNISSTDANVITLAAGANVQFEGLSIFQTVANGVAINSLGILTLDNCIVAAPNINESAIVQTNGSCNLYNCLISAGGTVISVSGATLLVVNNRIFHQQNVGNTLASSCIVITNCTGFVTGNSVRSVSPNVAQNCFGIQILGSFTSSFHFTQNHVRIQKTGAAVNITAALLVSGTNAVTVMISNNTFDGNVTIGGLFFNSNSTSFLLSNNYFQGTVAAWYSTSSLAALTPVAFANFPAYSNVLNTVVTGPITPTAPTATLTSQNLRV